MAYRCSFPGCKNITIGASFESENAVSITGVAAHISAAAEGGKRYNENMTEAERKSINNCIWMCQTHGRLIDTDEVIYPIDTLIQWKRDAEKAASKALADVNFLNEYYGTNGDNLDELQSIFDGLIVDGQFKMLQTMLGQYNSRLSEKYEEFICRYKVIYDTYCCRPALHDDLEAYLALREKSGCDVLIELFLSFLMVDELSKVVDLYSDKDLHSIACMLLNADLEQKLFVPIGTEPTYVFPERFMTTVSKIITNTIIKTKKVGVVDKEGKKFQLYSGEFYYQIIAAAFQVADIASNCGEKIQDIIGSEGFLLSEKIYLRYNA